MLISHRRILFCTLSLILTSSYLATALKIPSVNDTDFSASNNATLSVAGVQVQKFNKPFSTAISKRDRSEARDTRWTYFYVGM
jgi:hypothetical protein